MHHIVPGGAWRLRVLEKRLLAQSVGRAGQGLRIEIMVDRAYKRQREGAVAASAAIRLHVAWMQSEVTAAEHARQDESAAEEATEEERVAELCKLHVHEG